MKASKSKDYNFNYVFLFYDVNEKRVSKVFKVCKKYLEHYQLSVFRGDITPSNLIKLRSELKRIIKEEEDKLSIIKLPARHSFEEEVYGILSKRSEDIFY